MIFRITLQHDRTSKVIATYALFDSCRACRTNFCVQTISAPCLTSLSLEQGAIGESQLELIVADNLASLSLSGMKLAHISVSRVTRFQQLSKLKLVSPNLGLREQHLGGLQSLHQLAKLRLKGYFTGHHIMLQHFASLSRLVLR